MPFWASAILFALMRSTSDRNKVSDSIEKEPMAPAHRQNPKRDTPTMLELRRILPKPIKEIETEIRTHRAK